MTLCHVIDGFFISGTTASMAHPTIHAQRPQQAMFLARELVHNTRHMG